MEVTLDSIRTVRVYQPKHGYRFSVDSLLLFDFVHLRKAEKIADLGAGCGIVGILLAQKYPYACVDLFEIQGSLARLAGRNILLNRLDGRVRVIEGDLRNVSLLGVPFHHYDLVVSNPPFRRVKSGLLSIGEQKAIARHEITLQLHQCVTAASTLLKNGGRLAMIHLPGRLPELTGEMQRAGLELKRMRFVHSTPRTEAKMLLVEAVRGARGGLKVEKPLFIYREDGSYTEEMTRIYGI